jgi:predicted  nucleic acid-binding Zn-ribbon protein
MNKDDEVEECPNCGAIYRKDRVPHNCLRCGMCLKCPDS